MIMQSRESIDLGWYTIMALPPLITETQCPRDFQLESFSQSSTSSSSLLTSQRRLLRPRAKTAIASIYAVQVLSQTTKTSAPHSPLSLPPSHTHTHPLSPQSETQKKGEKRLRHAASVHTLAPAAAAWPTSFTHCSRLCAIEFDEHIWPTAYCSFLASD